MADDDTVPAFIQTDASLFQGKEALGIRDYVRSQGRQKYAIHSKGIGFLTGQLNAQLRGVFDRLDMVPEEVANALDFLIYDLMGVIAERTPVQNPPDDNIVAATLWDAKVERQNGKFVWTLTNYATGGHTKGGGDANFPYPVALEYGWSDQAPKGMVRISLEEFRQSLKRDLSGTIREILQGRRTAAREARMQVRLTKQAASAFGALGKLSVKTTKMGNRALKAHLSSITKAFKAAKRRTTGR